MLNLKKCRKSDIIKASNFFWRCHMRRLTAWGIWSLVWVCINKVMITAGMIGYKSIWTIIIDCAVSCFAAWFLLRHNVLLFIALVFLIASCILNFSMVSVLSFAMAILLLVLTQKTRVDR